jgi:acyl-CoA thioesterase YciA
VATGTGDDQMRDRDPGPPLVRGSDPHQINFYTRKWIRPEDLNANGTLFGGSLLRWIDEEATIYAIVQLGNPRVVTKFISEIDFVSSARQGDLVEMGLRATSFGRTSVTMRAHVRNMITRAAILTIEKIVFVSLDEAGRPLPHGFTEITYDRDRFGDRFPAPPSSDTPA